MANKYIISHRRMQVKTTMKYHSTPTRKVIIIFKLENNIVGTDLEKLEYLCIAGGNTEWYSCYGKQFVSFLKG